MTRTNTRGGFTLIELLVAMAIITTLAGFVLLVYPGARDQDRVRNTVSDVEATLKMAQGMAARDKSPRGVRFLSVPVDLIANPARTSPQFVTELQYIELPPPLIPNLKPLTTANPATEPRVRFTYTIAGPTSTNPNPPPGTITGRTCVIENLTLDQANQIQPNCTIVMPTFGSWHKIIGQPTASNPVVTGPNSGLYSVQVVLEVFPDAIMGAGTSAVVYHFAIFLPATPLVGEPTVLLPKNICVDMSVSLPSATSDFDVVFGPDGKLVGSPNGQLFFWVRDYTKVPSMNIAQGAALVDAFRRGGDQYIISVRASGALGHNQVLWPDVSPGATFGFYPSGQNAYSLARQELNQ